MMIANGAKSLRSRMQKRSFAALIGIAGMLAGPASAEPRPDQITSRGRYKELVETDTSLSAGSCTLTAGRMAARRKVAGYPEGDIRLFGVPDHPKQGGLLATLPGTEPRASAILLLAHLDVVEGEACRLGA